MANIFEIKESGFSTQPGEKTGSKKTVWKGEEGKTHKVTYYTEEDLKQLVEPNLDQLDLQIVEHGENKLYIDQKRTTISSKQQKAFAKLFFSSREGVKSLRFDTGGLKKQTELFRFADEIEKVFKKTLLDLVMEAKAQKTGISKRQRFNDGKKVYTLECRIKEADVEIVAKSFIGKGGFKSAKKVVRIGANQTIDGVNRVLVLLKPKTKKKLTSEEIAEFEQEAKIQKKLTEMKIPHIVGLHSISLKEGEFHGSYVDSCSAGDCTMFSRLPPSAEVDKIARLKACLHIAEAIEGMHGQGYCHNDIRPDNAMVSLDSVEGINVKLGDFGLARKEGGTFPTIAWRHAHYDTICSKVESKQLVATKKNDIWALAVTVFEIVKGEQNNPLRRLETFPPLPKEYFGAVQELVSQLDLSSCVDTMLHSVFTGSVDKATIVVDALREELSSFEKEATGQKFVQPVSTDFQVVDEYISGTYT